MDAIDVLIKYWGHTQFRLKQKEIISVAKTNTYRGCPGFKAKEMLCKKPSYSL